VASNQYGGANGLPSPRRGSVAAPVLSIRRGETHVTENDKTQIGTRTQGWSGQDNTVERLACEGHCSGETQVELRFDAGKRR
jgi:hypothetical protein